MKLYKVKTIDKLLPIFTSEDAVMSAICNGYKDCRFCPLGNFYNDMECECRAPEENMAILEQKGVIETIDIKSLLQKEFENIWDCEIDHPKYQDTVGELMEEAEKAIMGVLE